MIAFRDRPRVEAVRRAERSMSGVSARGVRSVAHYISVLMPKSTGGWRALFPDVPDCAVEGDSLDITVFRAAGALTECVVRQYGDLPPSPRELNEIKADNDWVSQHAIDWAKAVVTMVPLRLGQGTRL
jgi:hypothetical protein